MTRQAILDQIRQQPDIPVLIAGAGINGAGLFRELALQGVDALLIDKADFCAGASAAPSRMIHGGLRYLEYGEFRLVREALIERNLLLQNAPHYVAPLPTTIPIFRWLAGLTNAIPKFLRLNGKRGHRGALLVKMGLTAYDLFTSSQRLLPQHHFTSRSQALAQRPLLNPNIVCTATYYDASIAYPERLCLELILDATAMHPQAQALNYISLQAGVDGGVRLHDELSGETFEVKPKVLVNATGAWIDFTNQALQQPTILIGGTKGSHLIIDQPDLLESLQGHMLYYENSDGRICIMFPLLGKVLVGSTDIKIDHPDDAVCDEDEVDYMLESVRQVFPAIRLNRSHIVFRFCGVRPLPNSNADTPGEISRDHSCSILPPTDQTPFPIYAMIGGKWTTFRAFAEQVADQILPYLGQPHRADSTHLPIGGGKEFPQTEEARWQWLTRLQTQTNLDPARLKILLQRYGTRAEQISAFLVAAPDAPLTSHSGYSQREIEFIICQEQVVHLDDLILRRTAIALQGELTGVLLEELAAIMARLQHWSKVETNAEIDRTLTILQEKHGLNLVYPLDSVISTGAKPANPYPLSPNLFYPHQETGQTG
jgi:glycerol-3-phosphate dehydrogenase